MSFFLDKVFSSLVKQFFIAVKKTTHIQGKYSFCFRLLCKAPTWFRSHSKEFLKEMTDFLQQSWTETFLPINKTFLSFLRHHETPKNIDSPLFYCCQTPAMEFCPETGKHQNGCTVNSRAVEKFQSDLHHIITPIKYAIMK